MESKQLLAMLSEAIARKQETFNFYEELSKKMPNNHLQDISKDILVTEQQHIDLLNSVIEKITDQGSDIKINADNIMKNSPNPGAAAKSHALFKVLMELDARIANIEENIQDPLKAETIEEVKHRQELLEEKNANLSQIIDDLEAKIANMEKLQKYLNFMEKHGDLSEILTKCQHRPIIKSRFCTHLNYHHRV